MVKALRSAGILVLLAFLAAGCSKKSSSSTEPTTPPQLTAPTFSGPNTQSDSVGAFEAQSYASGINLYTAFATSYMVGNGTQNGNTWTWSVSQGQFTATWSGTVESDGSYMWKLVFNGPTDSVTYNNWTYLQGTTSADGKTGNWTVYYDNTTNTAIRYDWTTDSNGNVTGDVKMYDTDGTTQLERITVVNNADNSGEVDFYTGTVLTFKATWTSSGSGQWWDYDTSGTQTHHGTWS